MSIKSSHIRQSKITKGASFGRSRMERVKQDGVKHTTVFSGGLPARRITRTGTKMSLFKK